MEPLVDAILTDAIERKVIEPAEKVHVAHPIAAELSSAVGGFPIYLHLRTFADRFKPMKINLPKLSSETTREFADED